MTSIVALPDPPAENDEYIKALRRAEAAEHQVRVLTSSQLAIAVAIAIMCGDDGSIGTELLVMADDALQQAHRSVSVSAICTEVARALAQRLWGPDAFVLDESASGHPLFIVSSGPSCPRIHYGEGHSWPAAFADAAEPCPF